MFCIWIYISIFRIAKSIIYRYYQKVGTKLKVKIVKNIQHSYLGNPSRDSGKEYLARVLNRTGVNEFIEILCLFRALKVPFRPVIIN